jgi:biotin operon repressor
MLNIRNEAITALLPKVGPKAFAVLLVISKHLGRNNTAFPSVKTLMKYTGIGRDAVRKALRVLQDEGVLIVEQRRVKGKMSSNEYHVNTDLISVFVTAKSAPKLVENTEDDQQGEIEEESPDNSPCPEKPSTEKPSTEKPSTEKPSTEIQGTKYWKERSIGNKRSIGKGGRDCTTTVLISENLKTWINKSFKKAELYELVKDTAITAPELIDRFANYWVNVEGRNFDARSIADRNGVKTSLQEFARVEAAQTPVEEQNVENSPVSDGLDEIYQAFAKYTVRGVSENAKKTTKPILRQMIISGTTIDQFDKTFSKIKKAAAKYRDFEYTIKHWDKLQAI